MSAAGVKLAGELEKILLKRVTAGKLALPSMATAGRCLEILRDPDYKVHKLVEAIESEPMLALRVIAEANSAALNRERGRAR